MGRSICLIDFSGPYHPPFTTSLPSSSHYTAAGRDMPKHPMVAVTGYVLLHRDDDLQGLI